MLEYGLDWKTLISYFQFKNLSADPSTPESGQLRLYAKASGGISKLFYKEDDGTVIGPLGGGTITGSGTSGQVAFWNGTSSLTGDSDLTFSVDTLTVTKIVGSTSITTPSLTDSSMTLGSVLFAGTGGLVSQDNSNLFWDDTNNRLGLGTTSPLTALHQVSQLGAGTTRNLILDNYSSDAVGPQVRLRKARGTPASPTAVNSSDQIGSIFFGGSRDTSFTDSQGASISGTAGSLWTSTNSEGFFSISTVPNGSTSLSERFRVGSAGQWGIGGATFGTAGNYFRSGGASAAPTWATIAITELSTFSSATLAGQVTDETGSGLLVFATNPTLSGFTMANATDIVLNTSTGTKIGTATNQKLGFYNSAPVVQQTDGAGLTNNVTAGGTTNQIDNFTDLTTYSTDAATIRNDIYQLAKKLKIVDDALRTYGLLS